jgi:excisionase family DNA binding protein
MISESLSTESLFSLDDNARNTSLAAVIPPGYRNVLIARCAAIIAELAKPTTDIVTDQQGDLKWKATAAIKEDRLLTIAEVAEIIRFTRGHTYELVRSGELRAMHKGKYWRVRKSEGEKFITDHEGIAT